MCSQLTESHIMAFEKLPCHLRKKGNSKYLCISSSAPCFTLYMFTLFEAREQQAPLRFISFILTKCVSQRDWLHMINLPKRLNEISSCNTS